MRRPVVEVKLIKQDLYSSSGIMKKTLKRGLDIDLSNIYYYFFSHWVDSFDRLGSKSDVSDEPRIYCRRINGHKQIAGSSFFPMSEDEQKFCLKCGQPRELKNKGRITQWISVCRCGDELDDSAIDGVEIELCTACGKRVSKGRSGSFTQWILRSDTCGCGSGIQTPANSAVKSSPSVAKIVAQPITEESELTLDSEKFPNERYKPLAEIGRGAAGYVYLCRDRLLGKKVAVKCLRSVTAEQLVGFQQEAKATSQLKHPGIVTVMDFGSTAHGTPYMVMEYVKGVNLEQYLARFGPLTVDEAVKVFSQVVETLSYAHDKGILHRDIKSSNILILDAESNDSPELRVIDFGIAAIKHATQEPTIVNGNTIAGTPAYMAPDQVRGLKYDERSEIYSLGCVMFELLTGRPPFVADTALETIGMHAEAPIPTLSSRRSDREFGDDIEATVAKCLAKKQADRYENMSLLLSDLKKVQSANPGTSEGTSATETPNAEIIRKTSSTYPKALAVGAILFVCAFGGFILRDVATQDDSTKTIGDSFKKESRRKTKHIALTEQEEMKFKLDMTDDIQTNPALSNLSLFQSGRVTETLKRLVAEKAVKQDVSFVGSKIAHEDPKLIAKLQPQLISLSRCGGVDEEVLKGLSLIRSVKCLDLGDVKGLTSKGLSHLEKLPDLTMLNLSGCNLTDEHLKALRGLKKLYLLQLFRNEKITLNGIRNLGKKNSLLTIEVNQVSIVMLGESKRRKLMNENRIVIRTQGRNYLESEVSQDDLNKLEEKAVNDSFGPIGGSER